MPHTPVAASHVMHHWQSGTHLASLGFLWIGFVNVLMLVAFLTAAGRREHPVRPRGLPARRGPHERHDCLHGAEATALVSDRDRDRAVDIICEAVGDGRLSFDEGSSRVGHALASRTRRDIRGVLHGLPDHRPPPRERCAISAGTATAVAVVATAAIVQLLAGAWFVWPAAVAVLLPIALRRSGEAPARARTRPG